MTTPRRDTVLQPADPDVRRLVRLSRRQLLAESLAASAGIGLTAAYVATLLRFVEPARASAAAAPVAVTCHVFGSQPLPQVFLELIDEYMKQHPNVKITPWLSSASDTYVKVKTAYMVDPTRPITNLMHTNATWNAQGTLDDVWQPLNLDNIPNAKDIPPQYIAKGNLGIAFSFSPMALCYNTSRVKSRPTSWNDLWINPAFKGKTTTLDYQWIMNGLVMAARLHGGSERNAEPGWKILIQHADQWATIAASNAQETDLLVSGTVHLFVHYAANIYTWQQGGGPFGISIPAEGMPITETYLNIVKGTTPQQKAVCEDVINWLLEPRWLAKYAQVTRYVPTSERAFQLLPDSVKTLAAYRRDNLAKVQRVDWAAIAENDADWRKRWDEEVKPRIR